MLQLNPNLKRRRRIALVDENKFDALGVCYVLQATLWPSSYLT